MKQGYTVLDLNGMRMHEAQRNASSFRQMLLWRRDRGLDRVAKEVRVEMLYCS